MLNRLHLILYGILLFIILGLFVAFKILSDKLSHAQGFKDLYESEQKVSRQWKDQANHWHSKSESVQISADDMQHIKELSGLPAEVAGLKTSLKNLTSYNKVNTETTIHRTIYLKDSSFVLANKYDTITEVTKGDSAELTIKVGVPLEIVQYWDRSWFLGKKHYQNEVISDNPDTKVTFNKSIIAKRKRGLFRRL